MRELHGKALKRITSRRKEWLATALALGLGVRAVLTFVEQVKSVAGVWTRATRTAAALTVVLLTGCDPVVSIAGADFPDWLVCVIAGCLLCAPSHLLFRRTGLERHLRPVPFFYGSLILMFSLIIWVTFFNHV